MCGFPWAFKWLQVSDSPEVVPSKTKTQKKRVELGKFYTPVKNGATDTNVPPLWLLQPPTIFGGCVSCASAGASAGSSSFLAVFFNLARRCWLVRCHLDFHSNRHRKMKPRRPFSNWLEVHFVVRQWHFGGPLFRPTSAAFLRFPSTWKPWSFEWCKRNGKKITGIHEYLPGSVQCGLAWFNAAGSGGRFSREKPRALGRLAMSRLSSVSSGLCDFADVSKKKVNSIIRERAHVHVRLHLQNTRQSCVSRFTLETRNGNCRRWRIRPSCNSKRPASCCTLFKPKTPKKRTFNTKKLDDSRTLLPCGGWRATDQANQAALGHNQETYWTIPTVPNTAASQLTSRPAKSTPHGTHVHRVATNLLLFFRSCALLNSNWIHPKRRSNSSRLQSTHFSFNFWMNVR